MCFLHRGIGMGQCGSWFAQPEAELTEHPLALADPNRDAVLLRNPGEPSDVAGCRGIAAMCQMSIRVVAVLR
jgi:hypothetical protein